jgi:hypothetical protein
MSAYRIQWMIFSAIYFCVFCLFAFFGFRQFRGGDPYAAVGMWVLSLYPAFRTVQAIGRLAKATAGCGAKIEVRDAPGADVGANDDSGSEVK